MDKIFEKNLACAAGKMFLEQTAPQAKFVNENAPQAIFFD